MSAGGLSYSGLTNYGKVTLPSVEGWGTNMNILRDPPKMVMTRKIDKVGETSSITQMIQDSGNRACEAIKVYARGVNPMVKVSYDNASNNGGQRVNGFGGGAHRSAYLPYRIRDSFRPPIVPPQNLLPLSRLPRIWTSAFTQPGFADFSKKALCPQSAEKTAGVKNDMLRTNVRPTAVYQLETPIQENFEVKNIIQNPISVSGNSGIKTLDYSTTENYIPYEVINQHPLHADAQTNLKGEYTLSGETEFNTDRYIQDDPLYNNVNTNMSSNVEVLSLDDIMGTNVRTKETFNIPYTAPKYHNKQEEYIYSDPNLQRRIPQHSVQTNIRDNRVHTTPIEVVNERELHLNRPATHAYTNIGTVSRQQFEEVGSRDVHLSPKISGSDLGGYEGRGHVPQQSRNAEIGDLRSQKNIINDRVMEFQRGRIGRSFTEVNA